MAERGVEHTLVCSTFRSPHGERLHGVNFTVSTSPSAIT